jgi:hypothetical protein
LTPQLRDYDPSFEHGIVASCAIAIIWEMFEVLVIAAFTDFGISI